MGVISEDYIKFKNTSQLFSKIKRRLKNYDIVGLIDENNFPEYVSEVLKELGVSALKEEEVILRIKNRKACLPKDFEQLYAAYKCTSEKKTDQRHLQNISVFEYDITTEVFGRKNGCDIKCECDEDIIERVVLKQFVNDRYISSCYVNPILLRLSPNVRGKCSEDCLNLISSSQYEITIDNDTIYTNFDDDAILFKYFAFPLDDDGLPMIPDIIEIEQAIESYILLQIFMDFYLVDDIPNAAQKMQLLQIEHDKAMAKARFIGKLPTFSKLVNAIKDKKGINLVSFFSQIDRNRQ